MVQARNLIHILSIVSNAMALVQEPLNAINSTATTSSSTSVKNLPEGEILGRTSDNITFQCGGLNRTFTIYVPATYTLLHASPLMISFHGNGGTSEKQQRITSFSDPITNPDMIVVYPQGFEKHWQGAPYSIKDVDDVSFTLKLLGHMIDTHRIDESRIYASGMSNGGGFMGVLACDSEASKRFAAFAAHSGAFYPTNKTCAPGRNIVPFLEIHGDEDQTIPYDGGVRRKTTLPSIPEYVKRWAKHAELNLEPIETPLETHENKEWEYAMDDGGQLGVVTHVMIRGLGHHWAVDFNGFSSSPYILNWLRKWSLLENEGVVEHI